MPNVGQELLNVPLPEMVTKLALGIAEAQTKLDINSTEVAKFMSTATIKMPNIVSAFVPAVQADPTANPPVVAAPAQAAVMGQGIDMALISLGFFPGFYQFQEAFIEVKMAITMATSTAAQIGVTAKAGFGCFAASVNASYSSKYDYKVEGSSLLRVKFGPVPPPQILQDYMEGFIRQLNPPA
jgi:hypothetical protein